MFAANLLRCAACRRSTLSGMASRRTTRRPGAGRASVTRRSLTRCSLRRAGGRCTYPAPFTFLTPDAAHALHLHGKVDVWDFIVSVHPLQSYIKLNSNILQMYFKFTSNSRKPCILLSDGEGAALRCMHDTAGGHCELQTAATPPGQLVVPRMCC